MEKIRDRILQGFLCWLLLAEVVHCAAVFADKGFSEMTKWFLIGTVLLLAGMILYGTERYRAHPGTKNRIRAVPSTTLLWCFRLLFVLLFLYQLWTITTGKRQYLTGDMLVETAQSFLQTDGVYRVNPLTGREYTAGIPLRIRILGLPSFYGMLSSLLHLKPAVLIRRVVPVAVLVLSYCSMGSLGNFLFLERDPADTGRTALTPREEKWLFMVLVAVVFCIGDYLYGMDGFNLLYCGYRGTTIRNLILLPYTISLVLRKKYAPVALCILAELSITWTFYGMGMCLLTAAVMMGWNALAGRINGKIHQVEEKA